MADEMYGDGGVDFAKQTFAESRERKRIEAKRQEDFAKKLQLFDIGIRGVNFLINQRADNLETKQIPALAAYKNLLTSADASKKLLNTYQNAPDKNAFVSKYIYDNSLQTVLDTYGYLDENSVKSLVKEYSNNQAKLLQPEFDRMYTELQDVPDFETFKANYSKFANRQTPRNLFGLATKKIKNIFKSETPSTLAIKAEKQKNAIYDSQLYNEIEEYKTALKAFETKGLDIQGLLDKVKAEKDAGNLVGKIVGTPSVSMQTVTVGNVTTSVPTVNAIRQLDNGRIVLDTITNPEGAVMSVKPREYKDTELKTAFDLLINTLQSFDEKSYNKILTKLGDEDAIRADRTYATTLLDIKNNLDVSDKEAAMYVVQMLNTENEKTKKKFTITQISSNPTLYEFDKKNEALLLKNTSKYFRDMASRGSSKNAIIIKNQLIKDINKNIRFSEDEKVQYIKDLNEEFENIIELPAEIQNADSVNNKNIVSEKVSSLSLEDLDIKNLLSTEKVFPSKKVTVLNTFEQAVKDLDLSNLSVYELYSLSKMSEERLKKDLGLPKEINLSPKGKNTLFTKANIEWNRRLADNNEVPELVSIRTVPATREKITTINEKLLAQQAVKPDLDFFNLFKEQLLKS